MGLKCRKLGLIPAKADADAQREFLDERLRPRLRQAKRLRRVVCFVDAAHFVHGPYLGYLWCFVRLPMRGPSGRERFNVPGAIDAVTHELTTVCNDTVINAEVVCELLRKLSARYVGLPMTLVLDNARYQRCALVQLSPGASDRVTVPAVVLAEPEPDRAAVEVRQEGVPILSLLRGFRPVQGGHCRVP
jgi:hypothetical protein